uniref:Uncharacterized protein n=1 Tax=Pithovirus LCPAC403 TaxID=2506596 RepID=A0A481ZD38_9VIRU|nr:MAG: hypothetical protein LCPAC403_01130 [Pithovirus LCPAC403]
MEVNERLSLLSKVSLGDTVSLQSMCIYRRGTFSERLSSSLVRTLFSESRDILKINLQELQQDITLVNMKIDSNLVDSTLEGLNYLKEGYYKDDENMINAINSLKETLKKTSVSLKYD